MKKFKIVEKVKEEKGIVFYWFLCAIAVFGMVYSSTKSVEEAAFYSCAFILFPFALLLTFLLGCLLFWLVFELPKSVKF